MCTIAMVIFKGNKGDPRGGKMRQFDQIAERRTTGLFSGCALVIQDMVDPGVADHPNHTISHHIPPSSMPDAMFSG